MRKKNRWTVPSLADVYAQFQVVQAMLENMKGNKLDTLKREFRIVDEMIVKIAEGEEC